MKKTILVVFTLLVFSLIRLSAQPMGSNYRTALGFKFYPGAITVKHFVQPNRAIEGLAYFYDYGFRLTGLYEIHGDINGAAGLKWYVGPGAHIGFWNDRWRKDYYNEGDHYLAVGIDGVLGLDYKFKGVPLSISLDWQPSLNIIGRTYFESGWGGFGIRYTLK